MDKCGDETQVVVKSQAHFYRLYARKMFKAGKIFMSALHN